MKCRFCKRYVNEKREGLIYTYVNGRKIKWCKNCSKEAHKYIDKLEGEI